MRELVNIDFSQVSGARLFNRPLPCLPHSPVNPGPVGPSNSQIVPGITNSMLWGAGLGFISGGPVSAVAGLTGGAVQYVVTESWAYLPVNVPFPKIPMGPSWNGSIGF